MTFADFVSSVIDFVDFQLPSPRTMMRMANYSGIAFFWLTTVSVVASCTQIIIPTIWERGDGSEGAAAKPANAVILFFAISMVLNYLRCLFSNSYYDVRKLNVPTAGEGGKNWRYCVPCQQYMPPRAHHCTVCQRCVLKRDSHCFFIGKCIGLNNQRFFVVYCFYVALSSLYALLSYGTFLHEEIGPILSSHFPEYLLPYASMRWLAGSFSNIAAASLLLFYITMMTGIGCTMLFFFQVNLILQGQTSYEMGHKINPYDAGAQMNLREVFGSYWWLNFLIPVKFQLPVDGISWNRLKNVKNY